jgi:hypothetical protein
MNRSEIFGERGAELVGEAEGLAADAERRRDSLIAAIRDEQGGETPSTEVTLADGFTVDVTTRLDGALLNRLSQMEQDLERAQKGEGGIAAVQEISERAATLLADLVLDEDYDQALFLAVYEAEGLDAIGTFLQRIFNAIAEVKQEEREAADGFRPQK